MADDPVTVNMGASVRCLWPGSRADRGPGGTRAMNRLREAGIWTVADLTARSAQDIMDLRRSGLATVDEVRRALSACGLSLKGDDENAAACLHERFRFLRGAGLGPVAARRFARDLWPSGEISPGVTVTVAEEAGRG